MAGGPVQRFAAREDFLAHAVAACFAPLRWCTTIGVLIVARFCTTVNFMVKDDESLTTWDTAKRLGVTPERVRQLERAGILPAAFKTPGGVRIFSGKVVEALRRRRELERAGR